MEKDKINLSSKHIANVLILLSGLWIIFYYGSTLLLPLLVAVLIATLLNRPTQKFKEWGFPSWLAISVSVLLMIIVLSLLFWLISSQISNMADDWPTIERKAIQKYGLFASWLEQNFQINPKHFVDEHFNSIGKLKNLFKTFISSLLNLISQSFIILIYIILLLMQKQLFIVFFKKLVKNESAASQILKGSAKMINNYLVGKGKIMCCLFVMYYAGFTLGQVPFALFLALFAALFSIIPYVGNILGGGVAVVMSYLYSGTTPALIVIGVVAGGQLIENYILTPWIIGDEIDLNPFITIFGVILLASLWGMVGAVISLPLLGILKVFFKHTEGMGAYEFLLKKNGK